MSHPKIDLDVNIFVTDRKLETYTKQLHQKIQLERILTKLRSTISFCLNCDRLIGGSILFLCSRWNSKEASDKCSLQDINLK